MSEEFELLKGQIKENIITLKNSGKFAQALLLVDEYLALVSNDVDVIALKIDMLIQENNLTRAKEEVLRGLKIDPDKIDFLYYLACIAELEGNYNEARDFLSKIKIKNTDKEIGRKIHVAVDRINKATGELVQYKIAVICIKGLDSFIHDICRELSKKYVVKKVIVSDEKEIYEAIEWADIVWLEWANDSTIAATGYKGIYNKKVLVRLHGYEVFTDMPSKIKWDVVDKLIFVAEHKRNLFFSQFGEIIAKDKTCIIRNGIDCNKFSIALNKTKTKNIACIGNINYRKGIDLLLQFFYELLQDDDEYKLYIRGTHQDLRYQIAIDTMIRELGIQDKVIFVGRVEDINKWLVDMTYIVSSSLEESFHYSIGEGMLAGLKPVVHAWTESRDIWPQEYIFKNSSEFKKIILDSSYNPEEYRQFVLENYALPKQIDGIDKLIKALKFPEEHDLPCVTIGITNYNAEKYVQECIVSILNQTYKNIEILIIDDKSTDHSLDKLKKYAKKHKNIKIIQHEKNSGSPDLARREIIEMAEGKYFMLFDSDDFFAEATAVEKLVQTATRNPDSDYIYCELKIVNEKSQEIDVWKSAQYDSDQIVHDTFRRGGSGILTMKGLFKTGFFKGNNISYLSNGTAGDTLTALLCMKKGMVIKHLGEPLIAYRQHQNNFTFNLKKRIDSIVTILEYIVDNFSETVYFPEQNWNISEKNLQANKFYLITDLYYQVFKQFYEGTWKPWNNENNEKQNEEEAIEYLTHLRDLLIKYSQIVLDITDSYNKDINLMREKLNSIYKVAAESSSQVSIENKFWLRRIENEVLTKETLEKVFTNLLDGNLTVSDIIIQANQYTIHSDVVLNNIGAFLYEQGYIEDAASLFTEAYKINSMNEDVLLNLGIAAYQLGDKQTAKKYFNEVKNKPESLVAIFKDCEV